jgi:flagella basal body P-ring formation protein FlgA
MTRYRRQQTRRSLTFILKLSLSSVALIGTVAAGLILTFGFINQASAATLKDKALVAKDHVTLGDIFDDVGSKASEIVGPAPDAGQSRVISNKVLERLIKTYALDIEPVNLPSEFTIQRQSNIVSSDQMMEALKNVLSTKGTSDNFTVTLTQGLSDISLKDNTVPNVEISNLNFNKNSGVFSAKISIPSVQNPVATRQVTGTVTDLVTVPALSKPARAGEIISLSDIVFLELPAKQVPQDAVLDADQLAGLSPTRSITANKPIRFNDIRNPQLVERGEQITINYEGGTLSLAAKGRALQNGAKGEFVKVLNTASNKTIQAEVTSDRVVTVR